MQVSRALEQTLEQLDDGKAYELVHSVRVMQDDILRNPQNGMARRGLALLGMDVHYQWGNA